jgi:selenocysteine lyase/cysteine desulfurase
MSAHSSFPVSLVGADLHIPLIDGTHARYVNLDYAASAPALSAVADAVDELLPWYSSVHRGAGFASTVATEVLAASRVALGNFVGARDEDLVVFTRNTTDSLNLLARALPANTTVITFDTEHHANLLPWRRHAVRSLGVPASPRLAVETLDRALRAELITGPVLVAVTGASNVTGEIWPIAELVEVAHRHGARVLLDAAQLAPHRAVDISALDVDYLALSGHKLYAPFGAGVLVGRADWLEAAEPYLAGGGAVRKVEIADTQWATGTARHEAGTPNLLGAFALATAANELTALGFDAITEHETALTAVLDEGLSGINGLVRHRLWGEEADRIGVATFNLIGFDPAVVAAILSAEFGIGVRDGAFCAHPFVAALTHDVARAPQAPPAAVRASFGVGSTIEDIDRLVSALDWISTHGTEVRYVCTEGRPTPEADDRPRPEVLTRLLNTVGLRPAVTTGAAPCVGAVD